MTMITNAAAYRVLDAITTSSTILRGLVDAVPTPQSIGGGHPATFFRPPVASGTRNALDIGGYGSFVDARYAVLRNLARADDELSRIPELAPLRQTLDGAYTALQRDANMVDPKMIMRVKRDFDPLWSVAFPLRSELAVSGKHSDDAGQYALERVLPLNDPT